MELRVYILIVHHMQEYKGVRVNGLDNGERQGCIIPPWLFSVYMDEVMKEVKMGMGGGG